MGARWSAPLQASFGVPEWTGVVVTRTADTLAPAWALARTVGLLVVATFCVVLLVSFQQIRRLLDPIAKLHQEDRAPRAGRLHGPRGRAHGRRAAGAV